MQKFDVSDNFNKKASDTVNQSKMKRQQSKITKWVSLEGPQWGHWVQPPAEAGQKSSIKTGKILTENRKKSSKYL